MTCALKQIRYVFDIDSIRFAKVDLNTVNHEVFGTYPIILLNFVDKNDSFIDIQSRNDGIFTFETGSAFPK